MKRQLALAVAVLVLSGGTADASAAESPPRAEPTVCDLPAGDPDPQTQPEEWRARDEQNRKCAEQRAEDQDANPAYQRALEEARMRMYTEALADQVANPTRPRLTAPYVMPTNYYPGDPFRVAEDWAAAGRGSVRPVSFISSSGAKLVGRLFSPPDARGPLPAMVFTTGSLQGFQEAYNAFYEGLAEEGYLVLSYDVQGQGRSESFGHNPDGTPRCGADGCPGVPFQQDYNFFQGTRDALDFLFSTPTDPYAASVPEASGPNAEETDAYNPLWQRLDRKRVGIAGHSYGAFAVSLVGQEDSRVKAIVGFDTLNPVDEKAARIHAPALNITSEDFFLPNDPGNPPDSESNGTITGGTGPRQAYNQLRAHGVDAGLVTLRSSGHNEASYGGSSMGSRYGERVALYYTLAWFDRYLKGERTGTRRLLDQIIDDSADRSSIGAGTYDAATDRNVPYRIDGDCAANRVSIYFRSSLWLEHGRHEIEDIRARGC